MTFHRWVAPTYTGGLLPGYDYFNDPVANGFPGSTPALVDTIKSGGPNAGTYMVAFGEDAASSNANRGLAALAQNTDYLDDLFHRDIAIPVRTGTSVAGGVVTSVALPAGTFVGGTVGYPLDRLFSILDSNGNEIINAAGVQCVVASITGATVGSGFSSGTVTLNISPGIPAGVTYYIQYAQRGNLASIPVDGLTSISIKAAQEISAGVEDQFRKLQGNNYAWNHAWEGNNSIYSITWLGLQGLYNKATDRRILTGFVDRFGVYTDALNTPGAGAYWFREGPGIIGATLYEGGNWTDFYSDPFGAIWKATEGSVFDGSYGGPGSIPWGTPISNTTGFWYLGGRQTNGTPPSFPSLTPPSFSAFFAGAHVSTVNNDAALYSRIAEGTACTIATVGSDMSLTLSGTDSYFFRGLSPNRLTGIAVGYDMLVVKIGTEVRSVVITALDSATVCRIRMLDGGVDSAFTGSATILRWVRPYFMVGDGVTQFREVASDDVSPVALRNFMILQPPSNSDDTVLEGNYSSTHNAYFGASGVLSTNVALTWGGYSSSGTTGVGTYTYVGQLRGDGSIYTAYLSTGQVIFRPVQTTINVGDAGASFSATSYGTAAFTLNKLSDFTITANDMDTGGVAYVALYRSNSLSYNVGQTVTFVAPGSTVKTPDGAATFVLPTRGARAEVLLFELRKLTFNSISYVYVRLLDAMPS